MGEVRKGDDDAQNILWNKIGHPKSFAGNEEDKKHQRKKVLLDISEISLIIDTYDDIFSSFDPRPYPNRALSIDFLDEMKRAARGLPSGAAELKLMIPAIKRELTKEQIIKRRLREHFKKHYMEEIKLVGETKRRGIFMAVLGIFIMVLAAVLSFGQGNTFLSHLILILLEPAGWFTFWTGLDEIYYNQKQKQANLNFYEKMSQCDVHFISY